eukprot:Clim_evm241s157 gene=Clim_evmTU241s157
MTTDGPDQGSAGLRRITTQVRRRIEELQSHNTKSSTTKHVMEEPPNHVSVSRLRRVFMGEAVDSEPHENEDNLHGQGSSMDDIHRAEKSHKRMESASFPRSISMRERPTRSLSCDWEEMDVLPEYSDRLLTQKQNGTKMKSENSLATKPQGRHLRITTSSTICGDSQTTVGASSDAMVRTLGNSSSASALRKSQRFIQSLDMAKSAKEGAEFHRRLTLQGFNDIELDLQSSMNFLNAIGSPQASQDKIADAAAAAASEQDSNGEHPVAHATVRRMPRSFSGVGRDDEGFLMVEADNILQSTIAEDTVNDELFEDQDGRGLTVTTAVGLRESTGSLRQHSLTNSAPSVLSSTPSLNPDNLASSIASAVGSAIFDVMSQSAVDSGEDTKLELDQFVVLGDRYTSDEARATVAPQVNDPAHNLMSIETRQRLHISLDECRLDPEFTYPMYSTLIAPHPHQVCFVVDENLGYCAVSVRKEKLPDKSTRYRVLIMPSKGSQVRKIVRDNQCHVSSILRTKPSFRDVLQAAYTFRPITKFRTPSTKQKEQVKKALIEAEKKMNMDKYNIGVIYVRPGQKQEGEYFNNEDGSPAFNNFVELLGEKIRLQGFKGHRGGLDTHSNTTGTHSVATIFSGVEIMFHVSTLLPYVQGDPQQVRRKAFIGNDISQIVFVECDEGTDRVTTSKFDPESLTAQFPHVFLVVHMLKKDPPVYALHEVHRKELQPYPPMVSRNVWTHDTTFRDVLLTKAINGQHAAYRNGKLSIVRQSLCRGLLKSVCDDFVPEIESDLTKSKVATRKR